MNLRRLARVALLAAGVLLASALPTSGVHEWGHTYITAGRVLDASGDPVQLSQVVLRLENTIQEDNTPAQIAVQTDCSGFFYTFEGNIPYMHIHQHRLSSRNDAVLTVEDENFTKRIRPDMQRDMWMVRLAKEVEPRSECGSEDAVSFEGQFIVFGTVRTLQGKEIFEDRSCNREPDCTNVTVTLETGGNTYVNETQVNQFGDYFAIFENVTLGASGRIDAASEDTTDSKPIGAQELAFRAAYLDVNWERPTFTGGAMKGALIFLGVIAGIVVIAVAVNYGRKIAENRQAAGSSTRKRSR